ncbi:NAD(P)-dependent oxidoreductase [Actibacterium pelagium]|uniref:NAD(P)-dependent oxidoreductase n=1 Tax=Actibacterium pelagium TaxID=2029103 RepID=UPI001E57B3E0|nr:NAD(P)-dependent oxidoreductase [Actibacterium pelagium]
MTFIGFGEAAQAILSGWGRDRPASIVAFDVKTDQPASRVAKLADYHAHDVADGQTAADAVTSATMVFSVVTADQALAAAKAAVPGMRSGTIWLDCNSCAPETKRQAAQVITAAGGHYVDVAVMAPVHPKLHRVPMLLAGPDADHAAEILKALDMCPKVAGPEVGHASSIKMIRSVMIKGMEALSAECLLAARKAGVEDEVIASLNASNPEIDWRTKGAYNLERMMVHGERRAAEMREVAKTVAELGLPDRLSRETAVWQDEIAALDVDPEEDSLVDRLDRILGAM